MMRFFPSSLLLKMSFVVMMMAVSACVPTEQIEVTQERIVEAKDNLEEKLSAGITATGEAISGTVEAASNAVSNALTDDDAAEEEEIVVAAIEEEEEVAPPSLDPNTFLGQPRSALIDALGTEDYNRQDQGVEMLQFRMTSCIIDFVLNDKGEVISLHQRHRQSGQNYDDVSCRLDLTARRDGLQ